MQLEAALSSFSRFSGGAAAPPGPLRASGAMAPEALFGGGQGGAVAPPARKSKAASSCLKLRKNN
eukprot:6893266-Alexandrium_andersonii.AAC.1